MYETRMRLTAVPSLVQEAGPDNLTFRLWGGELDQGCRRRPKSARIREQCPK